MTDTTKVRRRRIVDVLVLGLFFLAICALIYGKLATVVRDNMSETVLYESAADSIGTTSPSVATSTEGDPTPVATKTDDTQDKNLVDAPPPTPEGLGEYLQNATTSGRGEASISMTLGDANLPNATGTALVFDDVTTRKYENSRLGFVMELPENWIVLYEAGDEIAFVNEAKLSGVPLEYAAKNYTGTQWMTIRRGCTSTVATSTVFAFTSATTTGSVNALSCVPPFLITLGLRSDTPDLYNNERFLLNVARTVYPIVTGVAPYAPIR